MNRTVLVTGGAGFIGSHLVDSLLRASHEVVCVDNFDEFYAPARKRANIAHALTNKHFHLYERDIRDRQALDSLFASHSIDTVVHLAARAGVRPSILNPVLYYDVNVRGTLTILEAMKKANVKNLVFASSSSVYGNNPKIPFSEADSVDNPISPYAATKKACELLCHTYHHLNGFQVFCLRFFTVYGPRQRPEMAIHLFIDSIARGLPIRLFGNGTTSRDYTYVDDIVQGLNAAIERVKGYDVINLGESKIITLRQLVALLEEYVGKKAIIEWLPEQPGDVERTNADIAKARELLAYNPTTPVEAGLQKMVAWYLGAR